MAARKVLTVNLGSKQPYEVLNWKVTFKKSVLEGQAIDTIESQVVSPSGELSISGGGVPAASIVDAGTAIIFWTAGGLTGKVYKITFQLKDEDTPLRLELDCTLAVSNA